MILDKSMVFVIRLSFGKMSHGQISSRRAIHFYLRDFFLNFSRNKNLPFLFLICFYSKEVEYLRLTDVIVMGKIVKFFIPLTMDKLQLTGQNLGRVFNPKSSCLHTMK
jgi:hypothetical protein